MTSSTRSALLRALCTAALVLSIGACGRESTPPAAPAAPAQPAAPAGSQPADATGAQPAPAASGPAAAAPADPEIARIYDTSCRSCHANAGTGAPPAGDAAAWAPRVAQGMDALLDHTIAGFNAMPPMGMCMQCSEAQFRALIEFMAGPVPAQPGA